ncbi:hypothetical protein ACFFWC_20585 [Plantactinospora siamensis]|uniref:Uncharacterized protein n=1 Tax=Plantactinospora siamensis TaxID=555372 RepID=A0ABV6NRY4_9ACTN
MLFPDLERLLISIEGEEEFMLDGKRFVARARVPGRPPRRSTRPAARGVAAKPDVETQLLQPPDVTSAIFVDHSGRRGRRLRWLVYLVLALVLLLLGGLWLTQADILGLNWPG